MTLQVYTLALGNFRDDTSGNNYAANTPVYILNSGGTLADIFRDQAGAQPIVQDGLNNISDAYGEFTFYVNSGQYISRVAGRDRLINVVGSDYFDSRVDDAVEQITQQTLVSRGFRVVGTFANGFTYELFNDVGIDANGNSWIYVGSGAPNKVVAAGTVPSAGAGYEQVAFNAASNVIFDDSSNVQEFKDTYRKTKTMAEAKADSSLTAGDSVIISDRFNAIFTVSDSETPNGIDKVQVGSTNLTLVYKPSGLVNANQLGAMPNLIPTSSEDVSNILLRAGELAGKDAVYIKAGGYNTGTEAFEGVNFVSMGNARSYQTITLRATDLSQSENDNPIGHSVIDMHYSVLRGTGARTGEAQSGGSAGSSDLSFAVASPSPKGSSTITLSSSGALIAGQLIAYGGDDGEFYTAKIDSVSSNVLTLSEPNQSAISVGNNVFAFYRNDYHPSDTGYKAIADHSLRELRTKRTVLSRANLSARGSGTLTPITSNSQSNPGSHRPATPEAEVPSFDVTSPSIYANVNGAQALFDVSESGSYEIHVVINTLGSEVTINWLSDVSYGQSIVVSNNSPTLYRVPAFIYGAGGKLSVTLGTSIDGGKFKAKSSVHLVKVESRDYNLNKGTHVFMGDSWFFEAQITNRLKERLPNAIIVNKGIGGEKAVDINARFNSDVTPLKPDFVWFMSGTNDWYGSVDPVLFAYQLAKFKSRCADIGATCLMFNSSVAPDAVLLNQWSWSRAYIEKGYYENEILPVKTKLPLRAVNVSAGVPVQLGRFNATGHPLKIIEHYLNADCNVIEGDTLVDNDAQTVLSSGFSGNTSVTIAPTANKFIRLESTGSGYVIIEGLPVT